MANFDAYPCAPTNESDAANNPMTTTDPIPVDSITVGDPTTFQPQTVDERFTDFYAAHFDGVVRYSLARVPSEGYQSAEDTAQDAMLNALLAARKTDAAGTTQELHWSYLRAIARNRLIDRHRARQGRPIEDEMPEHETLPEATDSTAALQAVEDRLVIDALLAVLPAEQRKVVDLVYLQDMKQEAAAAELGIPEGTVKSRLSRALTALKSQRAHTDVN